MRIGKFAHSKYLITENLALIKPQDTLKYAYMDIREAGFLWGHHYEISWFYDGYNELVNSRLLEWSWDRSWHKKNVKDESELGFTVDFIDKVIVSIWGRSMVRLISRTGVSFSRFEIYSPIFELNVEGNTDLSSLRSDPLSLEREGRGEGDRR